MPKISIVMPVYNHALYVADSIVSVLKQTEPDFEFIIVDDASTDGSSEIIDFYAEIDPRIQVIRNETNLRQAAATNKGAKLATGEYMAWHHSDDIYEPEFLEKMLATGADIAYCAYRFITIPGDKGPCLYDLDNFVFDRELFKRQCYLTCGAMIFKRSIYEEIGGYDETFVTCVDWDFSLRATKGHAVAMVPEPLFLYREDHKQANRQRIGPDVRERDRQRIRQGTY